MGDISEYLSRKEVSCKCGCGFATADYKTVLMFERVREFLGEPVSPNSWCRCKSYNERVQMDANENYIPGTSKSKHMEGVACDFPTKYPKALFNFLDDLYPNDCGLGLYDWGVHFDSRAIRARW